MDTARDWQHFQATRCPHAKERLFRVYLPLCRAVVGRFGSRGTVLCDQGDMLSFAYLGLYHALDRFEVARGKAFEPFAYRVMMNLIIDQLRPGRNERQTLSLDAPAAGHEASSSLGALMESPLPVPEQSLLHQEERQEMARLLQQLPTVYQQPLLLVAEGYTYEQIADMVGTGLGTVRSRISRGRGMMQKWQAAPVVPPRAPKPLSKREPLNREHSEHMKQVWARRKAGQGGKGR